MSALRRQMPGAFLKTQIPKGQNFSSPVLFGTKLPAPCWPGFRTGQFLLLQLWVQGMPKAFYICPEGFEDDRFTPGSREKRLSRDASKLVCFSWSRLTLPASSCGSTFSHTGLGCAFLHTMGPTLSVHMGFLLKVLEESFYC